MIRVMTIDDYDSVHDLWMSIKGFGIRSIDDSREGVEKFLRRNPTTSMIAVEDGKTVGAILCGHDGRRGCMYHVCVHEKYRMRGIGKAMAARAMEALRREGSIRSRSLRLRRMKLAILFGKASDGSLGMI